MRMVLLLVLATAAFRSFLFSPFTIPSESMLPGLVNGDYLIADKWPHLNAGSYSLLLSTGAGAFNIVLFFGFLTLKLR